MNGKTEADKISLAQDVCVCVCMLSSECASEKDMTNTVLPLPANWLFLYFILSLGSEKPVVSAVVCI